MSSDQLGAMTAWLQGLPLGATAPVTPSPEGCHPIPNGFNCNFDRQEEAMVRVAIYLDYFLLAILALLAIWIVASVISGRSLLPAPLERWRRRVPATPRDQRKQAAAQLLLLGGAMVNLTLLLLQPPNTAHEPMVFGLPAFLLGPPIVLVLFVAGLAALLSVRYANVPGGAVSSPWQDLKKAVRGSG